MAEPFDWSLFFLSDSIVKTILSLGFWNFDFMNYNRAYKLNIRSLNQTAKIFANSVGLGNDITVIVS